MEQTHGRDWSIPAETTRLNWFGRCRTELARQVKTFFDSSIGASLRSAAWFALFGMLLGSTVLGIWSCQGAPRREAPRTIKQPSVSDSPELRVRIDDKISSATLGGATSWSVMQAGKRIGRTITGPVRVSAVGGAIRVIDLRGGVHGFAPGVSVELEPLNGLASYAGKSYPGSFTLVPRGAKSPAQLDLINDVPVEDYLPGVLAQELYANWPLETYRTQAVAARSYALAERAKARDRGRWYDVDGDTRDQAYIGVTDRERALDAVASTRGIVLTEFDRIKTAYYSSTCGGRPALAAEIWPDQSSVNIRLVAAGGGVSAEREHACQTAPLYRWQVVRSRATLSSRVRAWARANDRSDVALLSTLHSIHVARTSSSGRPVAYELTDVRGRTAVIESERLRVALNSAHGGIARIAPKQRVMSNDLSIDVGRSSVTISGRGFGHGVGMCQYCAKGMGERGTPAETMLRSFYPTAELRRAY